MKMVKWKLRPRLLLGSLLCLTLVTLAIVLPLIIPNESLAMRLEDDLDGPSVRHILGAGENGIDVFAWLFYGARTSLFICVICTSLSLLIGVGLGAFAGLTGGRMDRFLMRLTDIFLAFPGILLAVYISSVFLGGYFTLIFALCASGWIQFARLARAQVLQVKSQDFVTASTALGATQTRILLKDILPNITSPILVQATFTASGMLLAESALSFLGLGLPPGTPSLGALLDQGVANILIAPHLVIAPALSIGALVVSFQILGEGLRDFLDIKL